MKTMLLVLLFCATGFAQEVRQAVQVGGDSTWDARAKFLAGVPLAEDQPLAKLQQPASYRAHSAAFEKMWSRYHAHYFSPMRRWSLLPATGQVGILAGVSPEVDRCNSFFRIFYYERNAVRTRGR